MKLKKFSLNLKNTPSNKKDGQIRQRLIREGGIVLGVLVILAGIGFFVDSFHTDLLDDRRKAKSQNANLNTEHQQLQEQFEKAKGSLKLYELLTKNNKSDDFSLDRESATTLLKKLNDRYHLSSLSVNMTPVEELKEEDFKKKTGVVISTQVRLNFEGITDEYIFAFINAVTQRFSGYVSISELRLERTSDITDRTLIEISTGAKPALVKGYLAFYWLGLKQHPEDKKGEEQPANNGEGT